MAKKKGPQFIQYFDPIIEALRALGGSGQPTEVKDWVADKVDVPEDDLTTLLKSGESRFSNQVAWGRFYLAKSGYIDSSVRGVWTLTEKGQDAQITPQKAYAIFKAVQQEFSNRSDVEHEEDSEEGAMTPEYTNHREALLNTLKGLSADGFERLCQRLLRESGFERVTVTGKTGDGGIDGIGVLQMTPFVSFKVLFQCKKYEGSVGAPQVRDFRGAMMGRADKGIIITTGTFTSSAREEATRDGVHPIELVDGAKLLDMFEQLQLGLTPKVIYEIDKDFFDEYQ